MGTDQSPPAAPRRPPREVGTADHTKHARWWLRTLDGFELVAPSGPVTLQPAAARLLALLAVQGSAVQRIRLAGTLWPDTTDRQAAANLRSLLWRVQGHYEHLIEVTATSVWLDGAVRTDLWSCHQRAIALLEGRLDPEANDIDLLSAELLPDWCEEWVEVVRERLRQRSLHALEVLCSWFTAHGQHALGLDAGLAAIAADPLRESAHRVVIAAHLSEGNHSEALRHYEHYRRLLHDELGLGPSAEMRDLVAHLLPTQRHVGGPAGRAPQARPAGHHPVATVPAAR